MNVWCCMLNSALLQAPPPERFIIAFIIFTVAEPTFFEKRGGLETGVEDDCELSGCRTLNDVLDSGDVTGVGGGACAPSTVRLITLTRSWKQSSSVGKKARCPNSSLSQIVVGSNYIKKCVSCMVMPLTIVHATNCEDSRQCCRCHLFHLHLHLRGISSNVTVLLGLDIVK